MIIICYSKICPQFQKHRFEHHVQRIPKVLQQQIMRYQRWQDRQARLLGKLLLYHLHFEFTVKENQLFFVYVKNKNSA